jgi:hypothetical protein
LEKISKQSHKYLLLGVPIFSSRSSPEIEFKEVPKLLFQQEAFNEKFNADPAKVLVNF